MTTTSPQPAVRAGRPGCGPGTWPGWPASGCGPASCAPALSALGIAIGVAAIVAVLGLAASAQAALLAEIQALGTNLLTVTNGQTLTGATAELPEAAPGMIARLPGVTAVQDTGSRRRRQRLQVPAHPRGRNQRALSVDAATLGLPAVAGTSLAQGRFLNAATAREPVAVLGAATAQRLGIDRIRPGMRIWAGGTWFYVTGILNKDTYAPEIDSAVLVGFPAAEKYLHFDGHPSQIYVRTVDTPGRHHAGGQPARRAGQPGKPQPGRRLPALGRAHRPGRRHRAPSTPCSSAWARSRCWSARSGWPTSWSSRCWNAAPRSGCAARWAPPAARSAPSSWPRRSCCPWPAASSASSPAPPPPPPTPASTARPSSSRPEAWAGGLAAAVAHRRPGRAAARHPRRTPVPNPGALEHLTARAPSGGISISTASRAGKEVRSTTTAPATSQARRWVTVAHPQIHKEIERLTRSNVGCGPRRRAGCEA